jgi:hypothetical protein
MFPISSSSTLSTTSSSTAPLSSYTLSSTQPSQPAVDPNSIELFRQNVALVQEQLTRVEQLAKSALLGVYEPPPLSVLLAIIL